MRPSKIWLCAIFLLSLYQVVFAQDSVIDKSIKAYKMPPDIEQYFRDKYGNQIEKTECDLKGTPNGPKGRLTLKGHISVKKQSDIFGNGDNRIKAIAESFLKEEAELLGLADFTEWQSTPVHYGGRGYGIISYHQNIQNLPFGVCDLGGCHPELRLQIENDEIIWFFAQLDPVSPDVYAAVSKKIISGEDAAKIVERDLQKEGMHVSIPATKLKTIIPTPPYVVWVTGYTKNRYNWHYVINALTGEIVSKNKSLIVTD